MAPARLRHSARSALAWVFSDWRLVKTGGRPELRQPAAWHVPKTSLRRIARADPDARRQLEEQMLFTDSHGPHPIEEHVFEPELVSNLGLYYILHSQTQLPEAKAKIFEKQWMTTQFKRKRELEQVTERKRFMKYSPKLESVPEETTPPIPEHEIIPTDEENSQDGELDVIIEGTIDVPLFPHAPGSVGQQMVSQLLLDPAPRTKGREPKSEGETKGPSECLAHHDHSTHGSTPTVVPGLVRMGPPTGCWRCHQEGHTHQGCKNDPVNDCYCFLCGWQNVKISNCPQCGPAWKQNQIKRRAELRKKAANHKY